MNGYQLSALAYRQYIERENPPAEERAGIERKIKALEFMGSIDRATQYEIFNSGGFNDIVKGYVLMALDNLEVDKETRADIMREIRYLFDSTSAEQAEKYYMEH